MNIVEQDVPEKFRPIIRRLKAAAQVKDVREVMEIEDDFAKELLDYEERIAKAESEKVKAERDRDMERNIKEDAVWLMLESLIDKNVISERLGISISNIDDIIKKKLK